MQAKGTTKSTALGMQSKSLPLQGVDNSGNPKLTNKGFHFIYIIFSKNLRDHEGQILLFNSQCPRRILLVLSSIIIQGFLNPVPEPSS